jgi:hypothetical protein
MNQKEKDSGGSPSWAGVLVGFAHQGGKALMAIFAAYLILTAQATAGCALSSPLFPMR